MPVQASRERLTTCLSERGTDPPSPSPIPANRGRGSSFAGAHAADFNFSVVDPGSAVEEAYRAPD
jgi:hypothetical protein